jgi:hypothetical protein
MNMPLPANNQTSRTGGLAVAAALTPAGSIASKSGSEMSEPMPFKA